MNSGPLAYGTSGLTLRTASPVLTGTFLYRNKNCTAIWEAFKGVLDKDPCSVLPSDYDLFINLSRHPIPRDKVKTDPSAMDQSVIFTSMLPFVSSYVFVEEKQKHNSKIMLVNELSK